MSKRCVCFIRTKCKYNIVREMRIKPTSLGSTYNKNVFEMTCESMSRVYARYFHELWLAQKLQLGSLIMKQGTTTWMPTDKRAINFPQV